MKSLHWQCTIVAAALAAFCLSAPLCAQAGTAQTPTGATGTTGATTPGSVGLPSPTDTTGAMNGGAGAMTPQPNGATGATGTLPDTNSAAGTYDQTSGANGSRHNWGWVGIFGLLGLFGLGGRGQRTVTRTQRDVAEPDVVTRP